MGRRRIYANDAERQRAHRARRKLERQGLPDDRPALGSDAAAVAQWAGERLRIPAGHPLAGQPFVLEPWQLALVDDVLTHRETLLCCARKNAKSGLVAVIALAHLVGPLRAEGWRCGVMSLNRGKAGELLQQIEEIAGASGIHVAGGRDVERPGGLKVRRTPWPGKLISCDTGGRLEIEGAGHASGTGHSAGYDLAVIDEIGLLEERHRRMVNGMRSAITAKNGQFLSLSIHGPGPFVPEILSRRGAPSLAIHHYTADEDLALVVCPRNNFTRAASGQRLAETPDFTGDCGRECRSAAKVELQTCSSDTPLDDPIAWRQANPGLGTIKSETTMRDDAARVKAIPADEPDFRAQELNRPGSPTAEPICTPSELQACELPNDELPPRGGPVFLGIDIGDVASLTSAAAYWQSGRLEVWTAVPADPPLKKRAKRDAVGTLYERAVREGHLWPLAGRLTPIKPFLERVRTALAGCHVAAVGADRRRADELKQHMIALGLPWRPVWRGGGIRAVQDAQHDIREFQRAVQGGKLRTVPNVMLVAAIAHSTVLRDGNGEVTGLKQSTVRRRIDALQAAVIALGLAGLRPQRSTGGRVSVA